MPKSILFRRTSSNYFSKKRNGAKHHLFIFISVYSLDDTIHDSITGVKGSLKKTLQAVELAIQNGIRVTIKTPLMESNKWSFRDLKKYCKDRSIEYIASCIIFSKSNGAFL